MHVYISEKYVVYLLNIFIYNINYININIDMYIYVNIFKIYTCMYSCLYIIGLHTYYVNRILYF